jgi:hypothetical protein
LSSRCVFFPLIARVGSENAAVAGVLAVRLKT